MSSLTLKVKTKDAEKIISDLTSTATLHDLTRKLSTVTNIQADRLNVLMGFPPKRLDLSDLKQTLEASGIRNGVKLIVDEAAAPVNPPVSPVAEAAAFVDHESIDNGFSAGILLKKVVPSDNSCLFTSIGYLLNGRIDTDCGTFMRQIIATDVAKDLETYNPAYLGKSNEEYCDWILRSESWGGAIEVSILANFYGIEIAVVDIINGIINHFGEDKKFGCRSFLLYDGIHYDPLYLEQMNGETKTMFEIEDAAVLLQAHQLATEAKASRQYTDLEKFTLKCRDCNTSLTGQVQAQEHAKMTGHTNFSEL